MAPKSIKTQADGSTQSPEMREWNEITEQGQAGDDDPGLKGRLVCENCRNTYGVI